MAGGNEIAASCRSNLRSVAASARSAFSAAARLWRAVSAYTSTSASSLWFAGSAIARYRAPSDRMVALSLAGDMGDVDLAGALEVQPPAASMAPDAAAASSADLVGAICRPLS